MTSDLFQKNHLFVFLFSYVPKTLAVIVQKAPIAFITESNFQKLNSIC